MNEIIKCTVTVILALYANLYTLSPQMYYVHPDHLNRPTKMTDASQNVVWDAYYWPWGDVRSITGTATNNLRFPGQYFLVESGLHYNWHRHYDPSTGRYIQPDPLGLVDGPSIYAYAESTPAMRTDPSGRFGLVGAGIGALVGGLGDLGLQLYNSGGNLRCVNWGQVGVSAVVGALLGATDGLATSELAAAEEAGILANSARGAASEARVLQELGLTKNTNRC